MQAVSDAVEIRLTFSRFIGFYFPRNLMSARSSRSARL